MKMRWAYVVLAVWMMGVWATVVSAENAPAGALWLDQVDLGTMKWEGLPPQARRSVGQRRLTVAGQVYKHGIGTHAKSSLVLDVQGKATRLTALVGVDDDPKTHPGSVEFVVLGDGKVLWQSGILQGGMAAKPLAVDLAGVKSLELRVTDGGDGVDSDHADWLEAKLEGTQSLEFLAAQPGEPVEQWNKLTAEQETRGYQLQAVAPGIWRLRLGTPEALAPVHFQEMPPAVAALQALPECPRIPLKVAAVGFGTSARGTMVELPMEADEQFYGLGMNLKSFELKGTRKTIRVSDDQGTLQGDSHAPVPFYVSTRGYGIYVDTARYASFYFGDLDAARPGQAPSKATADTPGTSTEELYRPRMPGRQFVAVDVPVAKGVDVYIIAGPEMVQAVQRYNLFSGGGCLPPMWGLGFWYRASTELNQKEVLAFLDEFRQRHIPCDVFGLEPGWHTHAYSCTFTWSQKYPDPDGLLHQTAAQGYKLNLWEHAFTHPASPLYGPLGPWSGNYKVWDGLVPDFATAQGRKIFADYHRQVLVEKGVSGFKLDECDHQPLAAAPWSFPERSAFPSGLDGEQMHLLFGPLYQRTIEGIYRQRNTRSLGLVRASGALAAPLSFGLYSDAYEHRDFVRAIATSGFGGILWAPEVRDMGSVEELYRRMETGVFSAVMQMNCWYLKNPVWKQIRKDPNNRGEFMKNWEQTETACRALIQMRMRLLPYLYAAYGAYRDTGLPPTRALVLDYPEDEATWKVDDEYLLGPALLVAPLFTGQGQRAVYLPAGDWYDFWTGKKYAGGRSLEIAKPAEQIPVFVKGGTLLPLAEPVEYVQPETEFALTVRVYGAGSKPCILYEDDGTSFDFEKGRQNRLTLTWDGQAGQVQKAGGYAGPSRYKVSRWEKVAQ